MNAVLYSWGGSFPLLLRHLYRTTTAVALRPLLSRQLTLGSFVDPTGLTTWTLPSTGFCATADAMWSKKRLHSARVAPEETPPASPSVPVAAAGMDCNLSGMKVGKTQFLSKSPRVHGSSQGHQQLIPFRLSNTRSMASDPIFPPGDMGRNPDRKARSAHPPPTGIPDRAPIPGHSSVAWFHITDTTKLGISQGDITRWSIDGKTDAIVNAANQRMLGGGGVDGAIHRRAGPRLRQACEHVPAIQGVRCPIGKAKFTEGFDLPASRVIHTVGPRFGQDPNPANLLRSCYFNSLDLAVTMGIKFIAFPAISCGIYGYPLDEAAEVSLDAIKKAPEALAEIHFIHFEERSYEEWMKVAKRDFTQM